MKGTALDVATYVGLFAVLAIRGYDAVVSPPLEVEDGNYMLGFYFHEQGLGSIFRFFAGYVSVMQNAIAWAVLHGPLTWAPLLFVITSIATTAAALFVMTRDGFAWLVADRTDRVIVAFLIALLPLGHRLVLTNLNYLQWNVLLLIVLLLSMRLPRSRAGLVGYCAAVVLCVLSHPLSIVALPFCAVRFFTTADVRERACFVVIASAAMFYQLSLITHGGTHSGLLEAIYFSQKVLLMRVVFEGVFGTAATLALNREYWQFTILCGATIALAVMAALRDERRLAVFTGVLALGFVMVLAGVLVRYTGVERQFYVDSLMTMRYFYVPKVLLVFVLLAFAVPVVRRANWRDKGLWMGAAVCYILAVNVGNHRMLYGINVEEGKRVADYLRTVHDNLDRAKRGEPYVARHTLERGGDFDIVLDIDKRQCKR